jgi:hypothetical protein
MKYSAETIKHPDFNRTYQCWYGMKRRCYTPKADNYRLYGARGITVCERWHEFENFIADMGMCSPGMSIERIDCNGNYEPANCTWIPRADQAKNRRNNIMYTHMGRTETLRQWAKYYGLSPQVVWLRYQSGDTPAHLFRPTPRQNKSFRILR